MEEKAWEHFMKSGSVLDYLEYRGVFNENEIHAYSKNSKEKEVDGRSNSDRYGVRSYADRGL